MRVISNRPVAITSGDYAINAFSVSMPFMLFHAFNAISCHDHCVIYV